MLTKICVAIIFYIKLISYRKGALMPKAKNIKEFVERIDASKKVILSLFAGEIEKCSEMQRGDYKTLLQEFVEKDGASLLEYRVVEENGPEHNKTFKVEALINNNVVGEGVSKSKKDAEMQAAKVALSLFGVK